MAASSVAVPLHINAKSEFRSVLCAWFEMFKGKSIHPEFLQENVTKEKLLIAYKAYDRELFLTHAKELREYLDHGSSAKVAKLIED